MFGKRDTEVLIVGAGPVGLFLGLLLTERGVKVEIVDEQWRTTARSYALALHPRSLELLDAVGLAGPLLKAGHRLDAVSFYGAGEVRAQVSFGQLPGPFPFVLVLPQESLERALESRLEQEGVRVLWNHRLTDLKEEGGRVSAEVERLGKDSAGYGVSSTSWVVDKVGVTRAAFVIGADGHRSAVRRYLGASFDPEGPSEVFAVFELASSTPPWDDMRVVLDPAQTSVGWSLGGSRFRFGFELPGDWDEVGPRAKRRLSFQVGSDVFPHLGEEVLEELLAERTPWLEGPVEELDWQVAVRFERRLATSFGRGAVWLVGDAAHLAGPVGVQSMNVGMREAHDLAERLRTMLKGGAPADLLERYGSERRAEWRQLLGGGESLVPGPRSSAWVESRAARILASIPASGEDLRRLLEQVGLELPRRAATMPCR